MVASFGGLAILGALLGLLGWASYSDATGFTIPNRISLAIVALYPAQVLLAWPAVDPLAGLGVGAAVLGVGLLGFVLGWMGGGDAKLAAALALWAGPERLLDLLLVSAVVGGLLAVAMLARAFVRQAREIEWSSSLIALKLMAREPVPYGIALAAGGAWVALAQWRAAAL